MFYNCSNNWKGRASVSHSIERVIDKETNKLRPQTKAERLDRTVIPYEISIEIEGRGYYDKGRITNNPETSYPPESEFDLTSITMNIDDPLYDQFGEDEITLTSDEIEDVEEKLCDDISERGKPDPDDDYDNR